MPGDLFRLMQTLFLPAADTFRQAIWQPLVDVYRTRTGWLVKVELAGVRPEDIRLSVQGKQLKIQGARRDWLVEEERSCYRMEISYSQFERTLELPCEPDLNRIRTDYQYGLLVIHIPEEESK